MGKLYAVGDIHGDFDKLLAIHARIGRDHGQTGRARIIHVGDLVDRRLKARETIQYLIDGQAAGQPWVTLAGNHDLLFSNFISGSSDSDPNLSAGTHWLSANMGGRTTLASYGVDVSAERSVPDIQVEARAKVPATHRAFLKNLHLYHLQNDLLFVHAGIRPGVALKDQSAQDLTWIRAPFHDHRGPHDHLIIHGHTPIDRVTHYGNRINIDTGAAYGRDLSAIVIERGQIWVLEENGRRELTA